MIAHRSSLAREVGAGCRADAEKILLLQRLCLREQAALYPDAPRVLRHQTLGDLRLQYATHRFFVARDGREIVGAVRARLRDGACEIACLVVHPDARRQGVGTRLLAAVEEGFDLSAAHYHVVVGHRAEGLIRFYLRIGYAETFRQAVTAALILVHLEKRGSRQLRPAAIES